MTTTTAVTSPVLDATMTAAAQTAEATMETVTASPAVTQSLYNRAIETLTNCHTWIKTIEKGGIGHYYTIASDTIDTYVVEKAAKPVIRFAGDQFRKHPYLYAIGTVLLLAFLASPNRKARPTPPPSGTGTATPSKQHKRTNSDPSTPTRI